MTPDSVPGSAESTMAFVERFDRDVDRLFDLLRDHPIPDRVFAVASQLGDWSLIWHLFIGAQALRSPADAKRLPRLVILFGLESLLVNQGLKRLFKRGRPVERPEVSANLREPMTSSFPSGHASSGGFAAVVLTNNHPELRPLIWPLAFVVAASRVHTRMHHPSDVLAGAVIGIALGKCAVSCWPARSAKSSVWGVTLATK